jgi:recombination protein RecT
MKNLEKPTNQSFEVVSKEVQEALNYAYKKVISLIGEDQAIKELGFAKQLISKSPSLQKCSIDSITDSVVNVGRLNITLNPALKLAHLIPRDNKCVLEVSYMGLISILKKSGGCKYIDAFVVYQDEEFNYDPANGTLHHVPYHATTEAEQRNRKAIGVYSRAVLTTGENVYCFMPMWEVDKVRNVSKNKGEKWSAWNMWEEEMIKKTVIRRHFKLLVSGTELEEVAEAINIEEQNNPIVKSNSKSSLFDLNFDE